MKPLDFTAVPSGDDGYSLLQWNDPDKEPGRPNSLYSLRMPDYAAKRILELLKAEQERNKLRTWFLAVTDSTLGGSIVERHNKTSSLMGYTLEEACRILGDFTRETYHLRERADRAEKERDEAVRRFRRHKQAAHVWLYRAMDTGELLDVGMRPPIVDGVGRGDHDVLNHHYRERHRPGIPPEIVRCRCVGAWVRFREKRPNG